MAQVFVSDLPARLPMAPVMAAKRAARKGAKKAVKKAIRKSVKKATAKKTKITRDSKGKRAKGARKSKKQSASGAKNAAAMKKAGKGIFAPKTLSAELAAVCGKKVMPRTEVTKAIWVYIKKNKLNNGRIIKPDATLKKVLPVAQLDMLKMAGFISKHLK